MRICSICGVNKLVHSDEIDTGVCRDCQSSMLADDDINLFSN
jgi:hypothetical protein